MIFLNQEVPLAVYASMTEMNFPCSGYYDLEPIQKVNVVYLKLEQSIYLLDVLLNPVIVLK